MARKKSILDLLEQLARIQELYNNNPTQENKTRLFKATSAYRGVYNSRATSSTLLKEWRDYNTEISLYKGNPEMRSYVNDLRNSLSLKEHELARRGYDVSDKDALSAKARRASMGLANG